MSRDFNGTTDRVDWSAVANLTGHALTISFWTYIDASPANGYFICIHDAGDASYGIIVNSSNATNKVISFLVHGTTDMVRASAYAVAATGAWTHFLITWTGVINDYTSVHIYKNGTEVSYNDAGLSQNGASETNHTGSWSLGGRIYSDTRNIDAKICEVAIWNAVLDSTTITALAAGNSPQNYTTNLQFHYSGVPNSLVASPGGTGTADGTTYSSDNPTIKHNLTATGVDAGTPTVGGPAITQSHALVANGIAAGAPTVGAPTIGQIHVLTAALLLAGNPTVGSPALSESSAVSGGTGTRRGMFLGLDREMVTE